MPRHFMVVPHTHWDREWYLTFEEFRLKLHDTITSLVKIMKEDSAYAHFHLDGQSIIIEDWLDFAEDKDDIKTFLNLIKADRISIGPWYVLPDEWLVSPEAIVRNLAIGIEVAGQYGTPLNVGYVPDQFGHVSQMPQIFQGFGIEDAVLWRGVGRDIKNANAWWEAPDGTRVFMVYMPGGYSNAILLPKDPDAMKARLMFAEAELARFAKQRFLLLMNGSDHQPPQKHLPASLKAAMKQMKGYSFEICSLPRYIHEVKAEAVNLPVHKGEFRSPERAPLLPGCTSARIHLKQLDFQASSLLERVAEPLTAINSMFGGSTRAEAFTRAWKLILKNHPHDSICGCSTDEVHREMETRYMKVNKLLEVLANEAQAGIAGRMKSSKPGKDSLEMLLAFRPSLSGPTAEVARGEFVSSHNLSKAGVFDAKGRPVPFHLEPVGGVQKLIDVTVPSVVAKLMLSSISAGEFGGFNICGGSLKREKETVLVELEADLQAWGSFDVDEYLKELEKMLTDKAATKLHIRVTTPQRYKALIVPQSLSGMTITPYVIKNSPERHKTSLNKASLKAGKNYIENSYYKVKLNKRSELTIVDKKLGIEMDRALWFEDCADRGDEYNFDPLTTVKPIKLRQAKLVEVRRVSNAAVQMTLEYKTKIPASLAGSRKERSSEKVRLDISVLVTLFEGVKRVEFDAGFTNNARDHRVRAHLRVPGKAEGFHVGSAFDIVERPLEVTRPEKRQPEQPIATSPQWNFSCLKLDGWSLGALAPGVTEAEPIPDGSSAGIALTLLRSVGWLSRADLKMRPGSAGPPVETPEAQCLMNVNARFALVTQSGHNLPQMASSADSYAHRPQLFSGSKTSKGAIEPGKPLFKLDNGNIQMSALYPSRHHSGAVILRLCNASEKREKAKLTIYSGKLSVAPVNLNEKASRMEFVKTGSAKYSVTFRPHQIVSLLIK